ncbi:uncharacterized protein [Euphorbia lathyris]|uniref:uncharacterized protein n=1 Tax=Euphorbia lathyris TaxID=212925 RepID=UPI00331426FD
MEYLCKWCTWLINIAVVSPRGWSVWLINVAVVSPRIKKRELESRLAEMALVSGGRSTLNPDAPLFIPAAYRQVEDFSPEWWQLVTTSTWYRDYWLSQHQDAEGRKLGGL